MIKAEEAPFHSEAGIPSTHRNNKKGFKFVIFSLLGIVIVFIAAYFMMNNLKAHNQKATQADSIKKRMNPNLLLTIRKLRQLIRRI